MILPRRKNRNPTRSIKRAITLVCRGASAWRPRTRLTRLSGQNIKQIYNIYVSLSLARMRPWLCVHGPGMPHLEECKAHSHQLQYMDMVYTRRLPRPLLFGRTTFLSQGNAQTLLCCARAQHQRKPRNSIRTTPHIAYRSRRTHGTLNDTPPRRRML